MKDSDEVFSLKNLFWSLETWERSKMNILFFSLGFWRLLCLGRFCLGISIDYTWIDHFLLHLLGTVFIYLLLRLLGVKKPNAILFVTALSIGWSIGYEAEEAISWWAPKATAKDFFGIGDVLFNTLGLISARTIISKML
jgi:hypothetical protein